MPDAQREPRPLTAEEYLMIERNAPYKSELLHGQIIRMAGASRNISASTQASDAPLAIGWTERDALKWAVI